jgi:N-acetylglutamate synthase-like GNAT family acetyltransferase
MNIQIRRAKPGEADTLTKIAHAAKRHWGYPENWIEHWKDDLTITPEFIIRNETFVATIGEEIVGCCAIVLNDSRAEDSRAELEHMWISPESMGAGVGRALLRHAKDRAAKLEVSALELSADPNSEGFYQRMGATRIGEVRSEIEGQPRVLPRMIIEV